MKGKRLLKICLVLFLACAALIVSAKSSRQGKGPYDLAKDLPRGPLVYVQFKDLPELLKKWDESELKKRYLLSTNYDQFQSRHLALKLVERWEEFNNGAGFQFDLDAFGDAAENRAAVA